MIEVAQILSRDASPKIKLPTHNSTSEGGKKRSELHTSEDERGIVTVPPIPRKHEKITSKIKKFEHKTDYSIEKINTEKLNALLRAYAKIYDKEPRQYYTESKVRKPHTLPKPNVPPISIPTPKGSKMVDKKKTQPMMLRQKEHSHTNMEPVSNT